MQSLAGFAMRGRSQAALVAAGSAVLSLVLPLVALISSAVVALATLRQGPREGALVMGIAGLGSAGLAWLALGAPWPAVGFLLVLWVPLWGLALTLRATGSLALVVQAAALLGLLILVGIYAVTEDPAAQWAKLMEPLRAGLVETEVFTEADSRVLMETLAKWMTGAFAASLYAQFLLALFIGRWWQAVLYNPGGFGAEFRELRLNPVLGLLALALLVLRLLSPEAVWVFDLLVLLVPLFLLQGLAVAHGLRAILGAGVGWLIALYVLLVLAMPYAQGLVCALGIADLGLDLRRRFARRLPEAP
ncbi:MAG TPA: hypothetical protein VLM84_00640 [Chromatiaceae bacterium]|nr:hypothetical protein [Chromatiaceae bacterium]